MRRILFCFLTNMFVISTNAQTLQSPEQFLGYTIGQKFTPHYKIVNYVKHVAAARPDMVKLEKYGETYEGRELQLLLISSAANMQKLESIRQNNLALAGLDKSTPATINSPAIVWLSYNVHGNEPSSSEAAMLTLYSLVDPSNSKTKEWLKNTIVIIDPCLNPDGRDRYVNWFQSVSGKYPDSYPNSREHMEPWPGGRSNHYNFDLNRDWAWQTQIESQQRIVKYNQWMPQVHVDFHEQFYNNPYYFAPAAEPFHEVITPWQREFQTTIGKNNAKYFDEKGWLYFTRESFDLFYPSYGDTYPTYNGAIGMTYEQGGHSRGGLSVKIANGDTLTLADRALHHFTTSLSTIEAASNNAEKLLVEFKKFFDDSKLGKGNATKTYVLTSDNAEKINSLAKLLHKNGIEYGTLSSTNFKGFNFKQNKEENGQLKKFHLAVSTLQPRGVLAKVLLESSSNLPDSNTYDITAWSLAYAYGIEAYSVNDALKILPYNPNAVLNKFTNSSYGYLVKYNSVAGVQLLGKLLQQGVRVMYTEKPITYKGTEYERGTLIILSHGNTAGLYENLTKISAGTNVEIEAISSGFMEKGPDLGSPYIHYIQKPKVALITGDQASSLHAGEVWHLFEQDFQYPVSLINANDISRINLSEFTSIIFPSGNFSAFSDKALNDKLKDYVNGGGKIIAMGSAVKGMSNNDWNIKQIKEKKSDEEKPGYESLKKYDERERDFLPETIPGAIYKLYIDQTHPLAFGYTDTYYSLKLDSEIYEFLPEGGWNVGVIKKDSYVTGFAGAKAKDKLKDALVFGVQEMGKGSVIFLNDDPIFRQFWENGKLLIGNAVFFVGQ